MDRLSFRFLLLEYWAYPKTESFSLLFLSASLFSTFENSLISLGGDVNHSICKQRRKRDLLIFSLAAILKILERFGLGHSLCLYESFLYTWRTGSGIIFIREYRTTRRLFPQQWLHIQNRWVLHIDRCSKRAVSELGIILIGLHQIVGW